MVPGRKPQTLGSWVHDMVVVFGSVLVNFALLGLRKVGQSSGKLLCFLCVSLGVWWWQQLLVVVTRLDTWVSEISRTRVLGARQGRHRAELR